MADAGQQDWLLIDCLTYEEDVLLGRCVEVEGLFTDLPPRPREHFTLVGCRPEGALAEALGTDQTWLGNVALTMPPPPPDMPQEWWCEFLGDVVVTGHRPSAGLPGTVDVDLSGFVHVYDRTDEVRRPRGATSFLLGDRTSTPYGTCRDVTGVFRDVAEAPVPQVRLLGCRPEPPLLAVIEAIGQPALSHRLQAAVQVISADGSAAGIVGAEVAGIVRAVEPSRFGAGLFDITVDSDPMEPVPTGVLDILGHWHHGRPVEKNLWAGYDRDLRHYWAGIALSRRTAGPDRPAGATYDLDGRFVTDVEGFYCALGEAINGPGGCFGWNLDDLDDCLCGGSGAQTPLRLIWHDSAVAREHLVEGYDRRRLEQAVTLRYLLDLLEQRGVEVDLR